MSRTQRQTIKAQASAWAIHVAVSLLCLMALGPQRAVAQSPSSAQATDAKEGPQLNFYYAFPNRVSTRGGTDVYLEGTYFELITEVRFDGAPATNLRHDPPVIPGNPTGITCTMPPGTAGSPTIEFIAPGNDGLTLTGPVTYFEGVLVDTMDKRVGPRTGNVPNVIHGEGFVDGEIASVTFGDISVPFNITHPDTIAVTPPPAATSGPVKVRVTHIDGSFGTTVYTYQDLKLTAILPVKAPTVRKTHCRIAGQGISPGATVTVGGLAPVSTTINGSVEADIEVGPVAPGTRTVDITVTNPGGESFTLPNALTFSDAPGPIITYIGPNTPPAHLPTSNFSIYGEGFSTTGTTRVLFGTREANNVTVITQQYGYVIAPTIIFSIASRPVGTKEDVTVINPDGTSNTVVNGVEYIGPPDATPPSISLLGSNPTLSPKDQPYTDPGARVYDQHDGDISMLLDVRGTVDTAVPDRYDLRYDAQDLTHNKASTITRSVYVEPLAPVIVPIPNSLPSGGFTTGRPGLAATVNNGDLNPDSTLTFDRPASPPPFDTPDDPNFLLIPTSVFEIGGLDGLTTTGTVRVSIDYADGDNDGFVDGTSLHELDITVLVRNNDGDTFTIIPDIDPIGNTANFYADASYLALGGAKAIDSLTFSLGGIEIQVPVVSNNGLTLLSVLLIAMAVGIWGMRAQRPRA